MTITSPPGTTIIPGPNCPLCGCTEHWPIPAPRPGRNAATAARIAEWLIRHHTDPSFRLSDLCRDVELGKRAAQTVCTDYFGLPPVQLRRAIRLHRSHALLLSATPTTKVSDIARRIGYVDLSSFSHDYRDRYGQPPSQTLHGATPATRQIGAALLAQLGLKFDPGAAVRGVLTPTGSSPSSCPPSQTTSNRDQ